MGNGNREIPVPFFRMREKGGGAIAAAGPRGMRMDAPGGRRRHE